jgi:enamine deaminase RidA (YjgF/YER057c/UK114 family)
MSGQEQQHGCWGDSSVSVIHVEAGNRYSQAVIVGDLVFVAGQVASDANLDIAGQMQQTLAALERILVASGSRRELLVSVTIYLRDIADYQSMNTVWEAWLASGPKPARATVEARLALPEYRVEVQAVASRNVSPRSSSVST